jgi:inhibitor of KinA
MKITPLGDSAVLIEVGGDGERVRDLAVAVTAQRMPGVFDVVPSFTTLAVYYDPLRFSKEGAVRPFDAVSTWLRGLEASLSGASSADIVEHIVPVCYGGEYGPDLLSLAQAKNLSAEEVVSLHASAAYDVRAIGFSPGFPYLSGLPESLHMARKSAPRVSVPAGSVGIGGTQTGIYTLQTPGGWQIIGRTPLRLFRPESEKPSLMKVGDKVRFRSVSIEEFLEMERSA